MPSSKKIALATSAELPALFGGEKLLAPVLRDMHCQVDICVWDDPAVEWRHYDAVVIRCPWDYYQKLPAFMAWLDRLEHDGVQLINDVTSLRWNLNKHYLFELLQTGLAVIPTLCVRPDDTRSLGELMAAMQCKEIVLKPVESAGAWRTLRVNAQNLAAASADFEAWRQEQDYLIQAFMPEVMSEGEWSLIFFDGHFSHAVIKRAKAGDFRVQSDHGGSVHVVEAPVKIRAQAQNILQSLPRLPCYARVDGLVRGETFMLMELELLEPELFLEKHPEAPRLFAEAIVRGLL